MHWPTIVVLLAWLGPGAAYEPASDANKPARVAGADERLPVIEIELDWNVETRGQAETPARVPGAAPQNGS